MKKLLILTLTIITLSSCSSNDENLDPLIGSWSLFSRNGNEVNDCEKQSYISFSENADYKFIGYFLENTNECLLDVDENGEWEANDDTTYKIIIDNNDNIIPISFSNNNNTITVTLEDGSTTILVYNRN